MINVLPKIETLIKLREKSCEEFVRAFQLIEKLDDEIYGVSRKSVGSIGTHFRHNLDLANNFLKGLDVGKIDYATRERDVLIEQDRQYAIMQIKKFIRRLEDLPNELLETNIVVRSEIDENHWHFSSVSRELEFIYSHTVHHHALIAEKLKVFGVEILPDFGVAPSTLKFWADRNV